MQNSDPMGPIIATREMMWTRDDGVVCSAHVDIGAPYESTGANGEPPELWCCRVRTRGLGEDRYFTLFGVDGIDALFTGLEMAATMVKSSLVAAKLDWASQPNFGFRVCSPNDDGTGCRCCGAGGGGGAEDPLPPVEP